MAVPGIGVLYLDIIGEWYWHKAIYNLVQQAKNTYANNVAPDETAHD